MQGVNKNKIVNPVIIPKQKDGMDYLFEGIMMLIAGLILGWFISKIYYLWENGGTVDMGLNECVYSNGEWKVEFDGVNTITATCKRVIETYWKYEVK